MDSKRKKQIRLFLVWTAVLLCLYMLLTHSNPMEDARTALLKKVSGSVLLVAGATVFTVFYKILMVLPQELYQNRRLIFRLAVNDFKKRYAGSYLGIVWALIPPIITVLMYWFVFDRIFHTSEKIAEAGASVPYVVFLTAGLVPWFFFSDAITGGTTALLEYNYLVKKVVFKISVLPIIKITAALFVHFFFTAVLIVIAAIYGYYPNLHYLQLLYYMVCEYVFVLGLCYATCSVVVFFRDLQQIISIFIQVGIWATPILWNIYEIDDRYKWIVKLNPLTYIVEGFRLSIYGKYWFWEHFYSSTYFWIVTVLLFIFSSLVFKKLKPMFADVL